MNKTSLLVGAVLFGSIGTLLAGPLQEAKINQIVNDVKVVDPQKGARPAAVQDTVRDQIAVRTGIQSRAELLFQDATLTRLGAETFFSFKAGTRDLSLERGTMLLQVPKNRGGARIRTASVTASITGTTIMIEHLPGSSVKVLVLEGSLRLSSNSRFGEAVSLKAGKMVIMKPNDTRIPNPVDVDIRKIMKSSALVNPELFSGKPGKTVAALPSIPLIEKEIAKQDALLEKKGLVRTNLVIPGSGTKVLLASDETLAQLERTVANTLGSEEASAIDRTLASQTTPTSNQTSGTSAGTDSGGDSGNSSQPTMTGSGGGPGTTGGTIGGTTTGGTTTGGTTTGGTTTGGTTTGGSLPTFQIVNVSSLVDGQSLDRSGTDGLLAFAPTGGGAVELRGPKIEVKSGRINGISLQGGDASVSLFQQGGDGGYLRAGTASAPISGNIEILAPVNATTGTNSLGIAHGGEGGTVQLISSKDINVKSRIQVSDSTAGRASRAGGNIHLESRNTGSAIKIDNSAQLLSLLDSAAPGPGGTITILATRGDIEIKDSAVQADRGTVQVTSNAASGKVALDNANIRGDTVKIGALGANGQLEIGRGTINADTTLKLYGGSSNGTVRFKENVTLGGAGVKIIAGNTVEIDNGKTVTIGGSNPASVHTNNANYTGSGGNGSKTGQFGGAGATTQSYGSRPSF